VVVAAPAWVSAVADQDVGEATTAVCDRVDGLVHRIQRKGLDPTAEPASLDLREAGIRSIVWASGFKANYAWIDLPTFDGRGHPRFTRVVSPVPGLYFLGLPWLPPGDRAASWAWPRKHSIWST